MAHIMNALVILRIRPFGTPRSRRAHAGLHHGKWRGNNQDADQQRRNGVGWRTIA